MNKKNIFLIASTSVIVIILVMLFSSLNNDSQLIEENFQNIQNIPSSSFGVERELEGDHTISVGNPKNTIIEYASMTCPHCSDFHGTVFPKIKKELRYKNKIEKLNNPILFNEIENPKFYFLHSYYLEPEEGSIITSTTNYGLDFCSSINFENIYATQFHPEKSHNFGVKMLENFSKL